MRRFILIDYGLSSVVWLCLSVFFLRILHVVQCVVFGRLNWHSFYIIIYVETIGVFVERLCLAELFRSIMLSYASFSYFNFCCNNSLLSHWPTFRPVD